MNQPNLQKNLQKSLQWTDVHVHLNMLKIPPAEAVQEASKAGVARLITIGTEPADWPLVIKNAGIFPQVKGALGLHPHHAALYSSKVEEQLKQGLANKVIIAVGEIGLDYYYNRAPKKTQQEVFRRQMDLAAAHNLPVEIHTRSAEEDTFTVLNEFKGRVKGLLHCFTGSWNLAHKALDMGFNISFSGIITFKNTHDLKQTCCKVPLNRLHLETDAPYLAPAPNRGRANKPAWLVHTAQTIAELHKITLEELSLQTNKNCQALFKIE